MSFLREKFINHFTSEDSQQEKVNTATNVTGVVVVNDNTSAWEYQDFQTPIQ